MTYEPRKSWYRMGKWDEKGKEQVTTKGRQRLNCSPVPATVVRTCISESPHPRARKLGIYVSVIGCTPEGEGGIHFPMLLTCWVCGDSSGPKKTFRQRDTYAGIETLARIIQNCKIQWDTDRTSTVCAIPRDSPLAFSVFPSKLTVLCYMGTCYIHVFKLGLHYVFSSGSYLLHFTWTHQNLSLILNFIWKHVFNGSILFQCRDSQ